MTYGLEDTSNSQNQAINIAIAGVSGDLEKIH